MVACGPSSAVQGTGRAGQPSCPAAPSVIATTTGVLATDVPAAGTSNAPRACARPSQNVDSGIQTCGCSPGGGFASASANDEESLADTRTSAHWPPAPSATRSLSVAAIAGAAATSSTVRCAHWPLPSAELIQVTLAQAAMTTTSSALSQSTGGRTVRSVGQFTPAPRSAFRDLGRSLSLRR
jgi:hypothetical protein